MVATVNANKQYTKYALSLCTSEVLKLCHFLYMYIIFDVILFYLYLGVAAYLYNINTIKMDLYI